MTQYLLSVHSVEGEAREPMTDEEMQQFMERVSALEAEMKSAGAWVFPARLHGPDTATVVRVSNGEMLTTDGPFAEAEGAPRRLLHHQRRGSRRGAGLGVEGHRAASGRRSKCARSRTSA